MIYKIINKKDFKKIKYFFEDIRFYMGNSVLDGLMGEAYVDDILNPQIAFLIVRNYCFIGGNIEEQKLKDIIDMNFRTYTLIPNDNLSKKIETIYGNNIEKAQRYSINKNTSFNINTLNMMANSLEECYKLVEIDEEIANNIKKQAFINITDNYKNHGIGICCIYNNEIIGVASSNIIYKDGIEVNIKVDEKYRRKGIATAMASKLILNCLNKNLKISWDAANTYSVGLAEKLGFEYESSYNVYYFEFEKKLNDLVKEIDKTINNSNETVSIIIKELNSNTDIYNYNSNIKIVSASTIKVPIMLAILDEVKKQNINLSDNIFVAKKDILNDTEIFENGEGNYTIFELINWMIIISDNTATNVLIKKIGMENINNYIKNNLKVASTYLQRYMLDENAISNGLNNYTSQIDMLNIFTLLFNKKILTNELCDIAINILYNQRCQDQLMRYIYEPVKFAHKTGSLAYLNHDIGIINVKDKLLYIGVSVYNSHNKNGNKKLVGNIGKKVYDYLLD